VPGRRGDATITPILPHPRGRKENEMLWFEFTLSLTLALIALLRACNHL
jgi:hypothetical protein